MSTETKSSLTGQFLYGYVPGEERVCIKNTIEQIAAYIMANRFKGQVKIVNFLDILEIQTMGEFIDFCDNKRFLQNELLPVLVPMQKGEAEVIEFVPFIDETYTLKNARFVNEEGKHVLINLNFSDECIEVTLVNDEVFDTEEELIAKYPDSISQELAEHVVNAIPYERDEFIIEYAEEYCDEENAKDLLGISEEAFEKLWGTEEDKFESFIAAVTEKVNEMTVDELLEFTFKHNLYIRAQN
ncbi:hypothetical protein ACQKNX_22940 [Lysinibacillus sp. NPDC093712]|uniref:hypothetical protein n=1 Tax=Lysinibacillus sp. NPDC093712 TaxID=3390579 RepID=UPI003D030E54